MAKKVKKKTEKCTMQGCCDVSAVYGLGFIGAAFYYITTATGFWAGVVGVIKALLWPAFLVFEVLKNLGI